MSVTLWLATLLLLTMTLLPLWRNPHWLIRGMDFPRLQLAVFALLLIAGHLFFLDLNEAESWFLLALSTLCLLRQAWWIIPYTFLYPVEVQTGQNKNPESKISILTANVCTPNRNAEALLDLVRKRSPDVLVTLESDQWWQDQLDVLEPAMPYTLKCPLDNLYGMHVYSRLPLDESEISFLVEDDIPSMHALLQLRNGEMIQVHFLHPAPPSPTENEESTQRDVELVIVAQSIADKDQAVIVAGDLNDVAWSRTTRLFRKISGLLDPRVGRGFFNTFHTRFPFLRWPLDHIFHSHHFTFHSLERLPPIGSDHFAILTQLIFEPIKGSSQNGLQQDQSDLSLSKSIAAKESASKADVPTPGE